MSKFIDNSPREAINSIIPLTHTDIKNIETGLDILKNDSNVSYEDIVEYFKWTKNFLARIKVLSIGCRNTNIMQGIKLASYQVHDEYNIVEVNDEQANELHIINLDDDDDEDYDDDDDDYDDDEDEWYEDDDDDDDDSDDDDEDEVDNKYIHQHFN